MANPTTTPRKPRQKRTTAEKVADGKARRDAQNAKAATVGQCRGRWSTCKGANPSRSATWHLCDESTKAYSQKKRGEVRKAAKDTVIPRPSARTEDEPARMAALVAPEAKPHVPPELVAKRRAEKAAAKKRPAKK
jgi:hypothetical protein